MKQKNIAYIFSLTLLTLLFMGNIANAQLDSNKCYQGDKEVPCPRSQQNNNVTESKNVPTNPVSDSVSPEIKQEWKRDILPVNFMADTRNDVVFYLVIVAIIIFFLIIGLAKIRIFGKTLGEYIFPIWYYILGSVAVVAVQYLVVVPYGDQLPYLDRITQAIWALLVALSVVQLVKKNQFNFGSVIFLGVIYSFLIHGLKVFIRYAFYDKTLFYALDRFIYGTILVMMVVVIVGIVMLIANRGKSIADIS
jgi:hypothetical protein